MFNQTNVARFARDFTIYFRILVFFGAKMAFLEDHSICQRNEIPAQEEGVEQQISLG